MSDMNLPTFYLFIPNQVTNMPPQPNRPDRLVLARLEHELAVALAARRSARLRSERAPIRSLFEAFRLERLDRELAAAEAAYHREWLRHEGLHATNGPDHADSGAVENDGTEESDDWITQIARRWELMCAAGRVAVARKGV